MRIENHARWLTGLLFLASAGSALGQDNILEEVVVTATKRALALQDLAGSANVLYLHLTLVPYIQAAGELKTKPTQHVWLS